MHVTALFFPLLISSMKTLQLALDINNHQNGKQCYVLASENNDIGGTSSEKEL